MQFELPLINFGMTPVYITHNLQLTRCIMHFMCSGVGQILCSIFFCCSQIASCYFISKCICDVHHPRLMIQWSCAILLTPYLLTHSHKAAVWFPYLLLEGSLSWVGFTRGRSAASVLCSVQTRTPWHPDASRLHRAVIVKELHKRRGLKQTIRLQFS